jgi:hypothetical protein
MLKKMASDALGLSDVGSIISPEDYNRTDADDYVMHEDNEKIYFLIKTKADEYCFTNLALIHVDGENAISSKRLLKRYPYSQYKISNVMLETAGKLDLDTEIKFDVGNIHFDIDVKKNQVEQLKDLYKALLRIEEITYENSIQMNYAKEGLERAVQTLQNSRSEEASLTSTYKGITEFTFEWLNSSYNQYHMKDFGAIFEKYINN